MSTPTISERVEQDGISVRSMLVATHEERHGMWQEWVCVLSLPASSASTRLAEPDDSDRADEPNEESDTYGRTFVACQVGLSVHARDIGAVPTAASVLQGFCQLAVTVENSGGDFWKCWAEYRERLPPLPDAATAVFQQWQVYTRQLKAFLGDKYGDYLWKTEWQQQPQV